MSRKDLLRHYVVPPLLLALIVMALFWRAWTPVDGARRAFAWDAQYEYWGDLQLQADAVRSGELPLWNPHDRLGYPFHADPQAGTLYPPQWGLIGASLALGETPWWLISIKTLLHIWLAALGMYVLLRRRKIPSAICYVGALVAITSYAVLHNGASALNWGFAWIPWWLAAAEFWIERPTWRRGLLLGTVAALSVLAGAWAAVWYGLLVVGPLAGVAIVSRVRATEPSARRQLVLQLARTLVIGLAMFAILAGAQLLSTAGILADTVRSERDLKFFGTSALSGADMVGFFLPRGLGENTYLGWAPILWSLCYVGLRPTARNLALVAVIVMSIILAMGDQGSVLPALASAPTPFDLFRRAHRYLYVMVVPLGILAAEGLAYLVALTDDNLRARLRRGLLRTVALIAAVCAVGYAVKVRMPYKADPARDAFAFALVGVLAAGFSTWMVLRHRGSQVLIIIAVSLCGLDLWVSRTGKIELAFRPAPSLANDALLANLDNLPRPHRIYDNELLGFRPGIRRGLRDLGGYEGDPLALQRYSRVLASVRQTPSLASHAGVEYFFNGRIKLPTGSLTRSGATSLGKNVYQLSDAVDDVRWYDTAAVADTDELAWQQTISKPAGTVAILERNALSSEALARAGQVDGAQLSPVSGRVTSSSLNQLSAEINAPADGIVVLGELWYSRGWTATVDGIEQPIYAVNGFARGLFVAPGHHVIHLEYRAQGFVLGGALALLGWLGLFVLIVVDLRRRRKKMPQTVGEVAQ